MASQGSGTGYQQQQQPSGNTGLPHQQSFPSTTATSTPPQQQTQPQITSPIKSVNTLSLCKLGQETNQELVTKLLELFKLFKTTQLPNSSNNPYQEKRVKIEESLRQLTMIFRKLRVIYQKVSEMIIDPDDNLEQVLVPLKGNPVEEKNTDTDVYKFVTEDHKLIIEVFVCTKIVYGRISRSRGSGIITPTGGGYGQRPIIYPRSCTRSNDCRRRSKRFPACCRADTGSILDPDVGGREDLFPPGRQGSCSIRKSGPDETCNDVCGCIRGYECYRPPVGACCPPKTCWTKEAAQRDRDKWNNCFPPTCFFPP